MSYRTYVEGVQIFGNNTYYLEWLEFIKKQGIEVSDSGSYEGEITDFMGALEVIENITLKLAKERENSEVKYGLFDWSNFVDILNVQDKDDDVYVIGLLDILQDIVTTGIGFMPYTFYNACKHKICSDNEYITSNGKVRLNSYRIKDGEHIIVKAG